jgi:hypothetical protein
MKVKKGINQLRFYSGFLLLGLYLTVGFVFLFTDVWADLVPKGRVLIGLMLVFFGALRFYIGYRRFISRKEYFKTKEEENVKQE